MNKLIAVTIGDINGIGIEILINVFKKNKERNFVLFTNIEIFKKFKIKNNIKLQINQININNNKYIFKKNLFNVYSYDAISNEENTIKSLDKSYIECVNGNFIGIVTLPLRKDLIIEKINSKFIGHTEYFQKLDNKNNSNMILISKNLIVSPITTHIKLVSVINKLKKHNYLYNQIFNLNEILKNDFKIRKPRLIISGLNPHAGENGKIGFEEKNIIIPVIRKLKNNNINIDGPSSADSILLNNNMKKYNCFIFLYHDQALIPFKLISNFSGTNYTGNLSVIRTSPDHGTAYNLVGKKIAKDISLLNSFKLIKKINKNRKINDKAKKVSQSKFYK